MATVGGEQTHTTSVIKKTLNPYWNEPFDLYVAVSRCRKIYRLIALTIFARRRRVNEDSILAIQIFDQKKFKKKDQGFLGVINVRIGDVIDLQMGGDGMSKMKNSEFMMRPTHLCLNLPQKCSPAISKNRMIISSFTES